MIYFTIGNGVDVNAMENENLEQQTDSPLNNFERILNNCSKNHVMESIIDDRMRNAVDKAVFAVKHCMHDATLTAMNDMAVISIAGSSRNGTIFIVQNLDRTKFTGNTENTSLRSVSSRLNLKNERYEIDETCDIGNTEHGNFQTTKIEYDRRAHAHLMVTGNSTPSNSVPVISHKSNSNSN